MKAEIKIAAVHPITQKDKQPGKGTQSMSVQLQQLRKEGILMSWAKILLSKIIQDIKYKS